MIKKLLEPTGDVCVKFTEDELISLNIKQGDKFSFKETEDGILLEKFASIDIDLSDFNRDVLEYLIQISCEKDISINDVVSEILEKALKNLNEEV
jgi:bifunctional DNA-binding transcriptional regulator/antitoxin component of YhaV-PrlF toxin-antitoxin module